MDSLYTWISHYGYAGLFVLLVLGIVGLPVPDETLLVFSGYLISKGTLHPAWTFLSGLSGSMSGISVSYLIGRGFGHRFVERYGRYVHLTPERIDSVNHWFHRIGHWLLTIGYFIPGVRHFTAFVAGMSRLEYRTFAAFAYPGAAVWVGSFLTLGYFLGENWQTTFARLHHYLVAITIVVGVSVGAVWWLRKKGVKPLKR
jgi:membrane protein DedA with SNARE-associated domain